MKGLYGCVLLCFLTSFGFAQIQSSGAGPGAWNDPMSWTPNVVPTAADGVVTIQAGHTITVTDTRSIDQLVVNGTLTINSGANLTIADASSSTDLIVNTGGVVNNNGTITLFTDPPPPPTGNATAIVYGALRNAGTIANASSSRLTFSGSAAIYEHLHSITNGEIPGATWASGATCLISGYTSNNLPPSGLGQSFQNFVWDTDELAAYINLNGALTTVHQNLIFRNIPDAYLYLTESTNYTLNVGGDLVIENSHLGLTSSASASVNVAGDALFSNNGDLSPVYDGILNLDVRGDLEFSGGTTNFSYEGPGSVLIALGGDFRMASSPVFFNGGSGTYTLTFNGSGIQNYEASQELTDFSYEIVNGSTVYVGSGSYFIGSGDFILRGGATLGVGSAQGLVIGIGAGNVQVTGARNYEENANIVYNGDIAQNLGTEWSSTGALDGIAVNLEIANTHPSGVTNNITGSTSLVGDLTLTSGPFNIGNTNTLQIESHFIENGGTIGGLQTSNLVFTGFGNTTGTLNFREGFQNLNNLTISRTSSISLGTDLTIHGTLSFANTGNLNFDGLTLTVNGDITQTGSGGLAANNLSNLTIGGTGDLSSLPFCSTCGVEFNNVFLGKGGNYEWNSAATVHGTLTLNSGTLEHTSGLIMAEGSTFARNSGSSITMNSPITSTSYNVFYNGNMTSGLELPSSSTALNNLTVSGAVTLNKSITINGDLNINSGAFNASTHNLVMAGANFLANGGNFNIDPTSSVTFARAGTTVMGGSTIGNTQFGTLTINSGATLSAPNANINIAGSWDNAGIFSPNNGSVTFNGGDQNLDANGQPFNSVIFGGTGTKVLLGALDVNGTLNINSTLDVGADNPINVAGTWTNSGTFIAAGGTVTFDGSNQTIVNAGQPFFNLTLGNGGTKTLGAAIDINGDLTINSNVTLGVGTNAYAINLAGDFINNGSFNRGTGTVTFDGSSSIAGTASTSFHNVVVTGALTASAATTDISGNWNSVGGTFNSNGGTIRLTGGSSQSVSTGTHAFNNLAVTGANTKTLLTNIDVNGNLTLSAGTLNVGSSRINLAGNFSANGASRLNAQTGLIVFDGTNQNITSGGVAFHNAEFSVGAKTLQDAFDANGNMDINVALAAGSNNVTVGGNWDAQGGSFTSTGITTFDGAAQNIRSSGSAFGSLVLAGSGTKSLQDALDVNGDITVNSTLDVTTGNFAVTTGGDWNLSGGTFVARAGSVTLDGTAQDIFQGTSPFNNLVVAGSGTKTQQDALDINGNLTINSGSSLSAGADFGIALAGNLTANGSYAPGASTLVLDGSLGQSIAGTSPITFYNITVDKSSGTATVTTAHSLVNVLTMDAGTLDANGRLTLVSTAAGDARIAPIAEGASITGNVIAQRYLPNGNSSRAYRYLASPVTNTFVSDWKAEFPITGTFNDPSTSAEWPGLSGPPIMSATPSMFIYNETLGGTVNDRYASYPFDGTSSTAAPIQNGRGYAAFVRWSTPITLNVTGTPQQGDVPVSVTSSGATADDGWNLVGNPYAAPINWENVTRPAGVAAQIAMLDNTNNSGLGAGEYVYYTHGAPGLAIPSNYDGTIASGQAFWVRATSNTSITFQEDDKEPVSSPDFIRQAPLENVIRINVAGNNRQDEMVIHFAENATDGADLDFDAFKLNNSNISLSSFSSDSIRMAINVLGSLSCNKEIGLAVEGIAAGTYTFNFSQFESFNNNIELRLLDSYTGTTFNIRNEGPAYEFSVSDDANSFGKKRFKLYVTYPEVNTDLTLLTDDVCAGSPASITLQGTQEGIKYYSTLNGTTVSEEIISTGGDLTLTVPNDKLEEGENALVLMASIAGCSAVPLDQSATVVSEKIYSITSFKNGKSCGGGQVSLSAEGAPEDGSYHWYESVDSATPIAGQVGAEFITPVLNKTQSYYVAAVNSLGCEGERKEVIADVSYLDEVAITIDEQQLTSSYAEGNQWYFNGETIDGATSQTIPVTETGLYEVEVTLNGCSSRASQEMIVLGSEFGAGSGISFYPNPVVGTLHIELPELTPARGLVQSSVGQPVGEVKFSLSGGKMQGEFSFEDHASGLYLIRVLQGNKIIHYKIIKK